MLPRFHCPEFVCVLSHWVLGPFHIIWFHTVLAVKHQLQMRVLSSQSFASVLPSGLFCRAASGKNASLHGSVWKWGHCWGGALFLDKTTSTVYIQRGKNVHQICCLHIMHPKQLDWVEDHCMAHAWHTFCRKFRTWAMITFWPWER